jgi:hypothetical protein
MTPTKKIYEHACLNHTNKKAKYFLKDAARSAYCTDCALSIAPTCKKLFRIEEMDTEPYVSEFTIDNSNSQNNHAIKDFLIDTESVMETNTNALHDIK